VTAGFLDVPMMYLQLLPHPFIPSNYVGTRPHPGLRENAWWLCGVIFHLGCHTTPHSWGAEPAQIPGPGRQEIMSWFDRWMLLCVMWQLRWSRLRQQNAVKALLPWLIKVITTCYVTKVLVLLMTLGLASPILAFCGFFHGKLRSIH